jgi:hypothetical protein
MIMAVDQTWEQRQPRAIDNLGARRSGDGLARPHGFNPRVADEDGRIALGGSTRPIDHGCTDEELLHKPPAFL